MTGLSVTEHGLSATGFVIAGAGAPRPTSRFRRPMRALQLLLYLAFLAVLVESAAALLAKLPSTRTVFFSGEAAFVEQLHPGSYGSRMIAEHAARAVREAEAGLRAESAGS